MARGYLDFSPLSVPKQDKQVAQYFSETVGALGDTLSGIIKEQKQVKQGYALQTEESKRKFGKFTDGAITQAGQQYVDKINQENIDILHKKVFLSAADKAKLQANLVKIDEYVSKMKDFQDGSKAAIKEYGTPQGSMMYENPVPAYEEVLSSLQPNEKGEIDESRFNMSMDKFFNTETGKPGLNVKAIAPDSYISSFAKTYVDKHKGNELAPRFETAVDPKLGNVKYQVYEQEVDWSNFDRDLVNTLAADKQGQQMFKYVDGLLSDEEKQIAINKYGQKDDLGRLNENQMLPYMEYWAKEKHGTDKYKNNIISKKGLSVISEDKPTEKETKEQELSTKPTTDYNFDGYYVKQGFSNPYMEKKNWTVKAPKAIGKDGELGNAQKDVSYETMNFNVAAIDEESATAVLSQNTTNIRGESVPKYYVIELKGNEDLFKAALGKTRYNKMLESYTPPFTPKEYDAAYSKWKTKYKTSNEIANKLKEALDDGSLTAYDYAELLKRAQATQSGAVPQWNFPGK